MEPELAATESLKGRIELVELSGEGIGGGPESESQKSSLLGLDEVEDVEGDRSRAFLSAWKTEAVMAGGAGEAIDVGVLEATENVGVGAAVCEVLLTGVWLFGARERSGDEDAVVKPAGVTEADGE